MHLLQAGVDLTVIALWLGHENPATTHMYMEADLAMKERALKYNPGAPEQATPLPPDRPPAAVSRGAVIMHGQQSRYDRRQLRGSRIRIRRAAWFALRFVSALTPCTSIPSTTNHA